jgi:hypothetical protein
MANGGFYGTEEQWRRMEAPLISIDPVLESFASSYGLRVTKNHKDTVERSIDWYRDSETRCLIQIWLVDQEMLTFNFWICASQDRRRARYWRTEMPVKEKPVSEFEADLPQLLESAYQKLTTWPTDSLEFAVGLSD